MTSQEVIQVELSDRLATWLRDFLEDFLGYSDDMRGQSPRNIKSCLKALEEGWDERAQL